MSQIEVAASSLLLLSSPVSSATADSMTEDPDEVNDETLPTVATVHAETQTDERMTQPSGFLSYTLIKDSDERTSYYIGLEKYALLNIILAL